MAEVICKYESEYNVGDVVVFEKYDHLEVGIIEGFYVDDGVFWFNIRISEKMVYTYTNGGDIGEYDIVGQITGELKDSCYSMITEKKEE